MPPKHSFPTGMAAVRYRLSPLRRFNAKGLREGVFGGNRAWLIAFLTFRGLLAAKRALSRQDERIAVDLLKPGERILIRTIPVSNAKERKRLLRGG